MKNFCKKHGITENQFKGIENIEGSLYLSSLTSIPDGFNPTVGGSLDLSSLTSIPDGFNPTVGGSLYLNSLTSIPDGFNPTVGGWLDLNSLTSIPDGFNPTVGGSLYLSSLTSIPDGFNPTVGGSLYLSSLTSIPDGFNPTVGGSLYLNSLTSIPDGFNPTVGGWLDLSSHLKANYIKIKENSIFKNNGKTFIYADNILAEVLKSKGSVYHIKIVGSKKETFLINDGKNFSHGETLQEAKEDLVYKITDRKKDDYKNYTLESVLTFEEAVKCYRTITGACSQGTKNFVTTILSNKKDSYSVKEMIELTKGQYGSETFKNFVNALN